LNASENKHICGQPADDVIGCCITDGSDENGCSVITKNECNSSSGGFFTSIGNQCVNKALWRGISWGCKKIALKQGDKCSYIKKGWGAETVNPGFPDCKYCYEGKSTDAYCDREGNNSESRSGSGIMPVEDVYGSLAPATKGCCQGQAGDFTDNGCQDNIKLNICYNMAEGSTDSSEYLFGKEAECNGERGKCE
jgi:hypothetical protein